MDVSALCLKDACFYFIVENVTDFSPASLALFPRHVRDRLLPFLPAVDLWRLESCPAFTDGMDMEEVWKGRVATHITAWEPAHRLEAGEQEATARETYLYYVSGLLLSSGEESLQTESPYDGHVFPEPSLIHRRRYDMRVRVSFRLKRSQLKYPTHYLNFLGTTPELVDKGEYIDFLFYGINMKEVPYLLDFSVYSFDSQKEYYVPHRYTSHGSKKYPRRSQFLSPVSSTFGHVRTISVPHPEWFQTMIAFLMQCSGWTPTKLKVVSPSKEFVRSTSNGRLLKFLSSVEEINVPVFTDCEVPELVDVLTALVNSRSGLSPTSINIETKYRYQLSWLLPKLSVVCGSFSGSKGYSGLRKITIGTLETQQIRFTSMPDWSGLLFQEKIESIRLVRLKTSTSASLLYILRILIVTRPSLRLVELIDCSFSDEALASLAADFLSTASTHPQSLLVRKWQAPSHLDIEKMKRQEINHELMCAVRQLPNPSHSCPSKDNKTLCLPFIPNGLCSLPWLLSFQLSSLELIVRWDNRLKELLHHLTVTEHPVPDGSITVTIEATVPSGVEQSCAGIICDLAMCSFVSEVRIIEV